jgi:hypothetical protein
MDSLAIGGLTNLFFLEEWDQSILPGRMDSLVIGGVTNLFFLEEWICLQLVE